ncbi:hypothetical protein CHUAL_009276 [Chamberlinius hualienensis]
MSSIFLRLQLMATTSKNCCLINNICNMRGSSTQSKYRTLDDILTWRQYMDKNGISKATDSTRHETHDLASKISYFEGDITLLQIGAIVNAANRSLLGGGGVDGCIHRAAGAELLKECRSLGGCNTGDAKITKGYNLPCDYVIHTVGPINEDPDKLESCYKRSFDLVRQYKVKSVAFPCIATGIYGFPNEKAAHIALKNTKHFLKENNDVIDRVIFCVFTDKDKSIYKRLLPQYFQ